MNQRRRRPSPFPCDKAPRGGRDPPSPARRPPGRSSAPRAARLTAPTAGGPAPAPAASPATEGSAPPRRPCGGDTRSAHAGDAPPSPRVSTASPCPVSLSASSYLVVLSVVCSSASWIAWGQETPALRQLPARSRRRSRWAEGSRLPGPPSPKPSLCAAGRGPGVAFPSNVPERRARAQRRRRPPGRAGALSQRAAAAASTAGQGARPSPLGCVLKWQRERQ